MLRCLQALGPTTRKHLFAHTLVVCWSRVITEADARGPSGRLDPSTDGSLVNFGNLEKMPLACVLQMLIRPSSRSM